MERTTSRDGFGAAAARLAERFGGKIGFAATNLATGESLAWNADAVLPTASVIKVPVLVELYRQAAAGDLDLDERREMRAGDKVGGSGVLKELAAGLRPTLRDLAVLMVVVSDNTATNMLIDAVGGVEAVNRTMRDRLGLPTVALHNRVDFERIGPDVRRFGEASPRDLVRLMALIARGEAVSADASAAMLDILRRQQYLDQVPRYLRVNPYAKDLGLEPEMWVGCKTGFFPGTRADAGVLRLPGEALVAYAAMTHESRDESFRPEAEPAMVNGLLGRLMVARWWPGADAESDALAPTPYAAAPLA